LDSELKLFINQATIKPEGCFSTCQPHFKVCW